MRGDQKASRRALPILAASNLLPSPRTRSYNARMNKPLKITKIGNSAGIVLPKDVLAHLDRQVGDELTLVLKPNGIELVGGEPDFEEQMAAARKVMAARKRALRELAK